MIDKNALLWERGFGCEQCGSNQTIEAHHALFHRAKGKEFLDDPRNIILLCKSCHEFANSYEFRCWAWQQNCDRYGQESMMSWWEDLPLKTKERFW